jgi:hypothetical protein
MYLQALSDGRRLIGIYGCRLGGDGDDDDDDDEDGYAVEREAGFFKRSSPSRREPFLTQIADSSLFVRASDLRRVAIPCAKSVLRGAFHWQHWR